MRNRYVLVVEPGDRGDGGPGALFRLEGASVEVVNSLGLADRCIRADPVDVVVLGALPRGAHLDWLRRLRRDRRHRYLPVVFLTAAKGVAATVDALEAGADDALRTPVSPRELLARCRALLRRSGEPSSEGVLECGDIRLEAANHRVFVEDRLATLGPTEFQLLKLLMRKPGHAFSRKQLLQHLRASNATIGERAIDVHVRRLRKSLEEAAEGAGQRVQTVWGVGYRCHDGAEEPAAAQARR